jgi:rhodanese-related sulfurtransferase
MPPDLKRNAKMSTAKLEKLPCTAVCEALKAPENIQIIDVRTPLEFDGVKLAGAVNIPLDEIQNRAGEIKKDKKLILVCKSGMRAGRAAETLGKYGYEACVMEGGMTAWQKAGLPVCAGKERLSLERQVQLTIGLMVLTGVILGFTVNKLFFLIPGFIGCGLTFAGLTGTCALALLIAKAPWNKL